VDATKNSVGMVCLKNLLIGMSVVVKIICGQNGNSV